MAIVTLKTLLESGVHYGTKSSLWHPRMKPFIYGKRNGIHLINLRETAKALIEAFHFVSKLSRQNKVVLFVGTKRQAKDVVREAAKAAGMPYVVERWLGGTLTNNETVRSSIRRLEEIEATQNKPEYLRESKKAVARHQRERKRILRNLEGVRSMSKLPDAIFVIDPTKEKTAVLEARRLNIPIIALLDSDCDPDMVNLPIPGNDDGIRAIQAVTKVMVDGIAKGRSDQITRRAEDEAAKVVAAEQAKVAAETAKIERAKAVEDKAKAAEESAMKAAEEKPAQLAPVKVPEKVPTKFGRFGKSGGSAGAPKK